VTHEAETHSCSCNSDFFVLTFVGTAKATPIAYLTLQSQPGDYVGAGGNFDITYLNFASTLILRTIASRPAEILFDLGNVVPDNNLALLSFGTDRLGIPMQPGVYLNAQRADFADPGHPGLDVEFQNRGCNTVTGNFTVQGAQFIGTAIDRFAATFEQHREGATPALFGTFSFDSGISRIPEPTSLPLTASGLLVFWIIKKRSGTTSTV
jgi:hypothetical protein